VRTPHTPSLRPRANAAHDTTTRLGERDEVAAIRELERALAAARSDGAREVVVHRVVPAVERTERTARDVVEQIMVLARVEVGDIHVRGEQKRGERARRRRRERGAREVEPTFLDVRRDAEEVHVKPAAPRECECRLDAQRGRSRRRPRPLPPPTPQPPQRPNRTTRYRANCQH